MKGDEKGEESGWAGWTCSESGRIIDMVGIDVLLRGAAFRKLRS